MRSRRSLGLLAAALVAATLHAGHAAPAAAATLAQVARWTTPYTSFDAKVSEAFSTPAVGDVDGDGHPDIVVGGHDGVLSAFSTGPDRPRFLAYDTGSKAIHASPTLVDLDGDGTLDILTATLSGRVIGLTGTGRVLFDRSDGAGPGRPRGFFATPVAGDIDGNGDLEIVAASWDTYVYAWNLDGSLVRGFPVWVYDTVWSSPALADLDRDGKREIVFGGDMDAYPGAPYPAGGLLWALRSDGSRQPGFPRSLPGQVIWSSPAVTDISGDGRLDVVVGTGTMFPTGGRKLWGLDASGRDLPGWPQATPGKVMASPAIGDLTGDGHPEVAAQTEGGWVVVHAGNGSRLWATCNSSAGTGCTSDAPMHGAVSIADVDGDGEQEVVGAAEHRLRVLDGSTGAVEAAILMSGSAWAPPAPPTIASVDGQAWIIQHVTFDTKPGDGRGVGDSQVVVAYTLGSALGRADWPTFRQSARRLGAVVDETGPATTIGALPGTSSSTRVPVAVSATDASGVSRFFVEVREGAGPWVRWVHDRAAPASGPATFTEGLHGRLGATYTVRARARDRAGNLGAWATATTTVEPSATRAEPFFAAYSVATSGTLGSISSAPRLGPVLSPRLGRDVVVRPDSSGWVLSGDGELTSFGGAPAAAIRASWPGQDVARALALNPDGTSGYVLEGGGRLRPFGGAVAVSGPSFGRDIARDVVLTPSSTAAAPAGYVLDGLGGVHRFGSAPALRNRASFSGDLARGMTLDPSGLSGYVVDAYGGLHALGTATTPSSGPYWAGSDRARAVASLAPGQGWILDSNGRVHPYGGAPALEVPLTWGAAMARGFAVARF
jgi:hypothetical protein